MASSRSDTARRVARGGAATGRAAWVAALLWAAPALAQVPRAPTPDVLDAEPEAPVGTLPDGTRRVSGRVVTPRDGQEAGVPGVWVTLHRVGRDTAGPVDSVRSAADGGYAFRFRPTGRADAVYFVAASQGGVAYFTPPLREVDVRGEAAEVVVFDTTSRPVRLSVRGRHLIVAAPGADGAREVLEVYELSNDTSVTAVPPAGAARGVWSSPLPPGVRQVQVRESGDVPGDGLAVVGGAATLLVPVAPGIRQVAYSYKLPAGDLALRLPVAGAGLLEVLVEEPSATVAGGGLAPVEPVALEGKSFRRYLAQEAAAGSTIAVTSGGGAGGSAARLAVPALIAVVGGGMVAALVLAARRRAPAPVARPAPNATGVPAAAAAPLGSGPSPDDRDRLLRELAALDDAHAREGTSPDVRAAYEARRGELKAALARALAGAGTPG